MADENYKRKLTAILSSDVVGYSRLMGDNEVATVSTLKSRRNLISEKVQAFNGRVVDIPGDNLLAEFRSIVDAVKCAVAIQERLRAENDKLPDSRKMHFRIGVNLDDVSLTNLLHLPVFLSTIKKIQVIINFFWPYRIVLSFVSIIIKLIDPIDILRQLLFSYDMPRQKVLSKFFYFYPQDNYFCELCVFSV
jgi:hypothetical protein